jgi:hypothetical protein
MSAVMTSLSIPSLGTKYSFVRAEAACARLSRSRSLSLPDMMRKADENCCKKERKPRHKDGCDAGHAHHVSLGRRGWVAQDRESAWEEKAWKRSNVVTGAGGGASRRNSPGGAGRPVQLSGNGESKWNSC